MSAPQRHTTGELDLAATREALLRFQPGSNWVSMSRDPTPRMTIGLGFDLGRGGASEMLRDVGVNPAAVRNGHAAISDSQMRELFDLTLLAAIEWAERRIPGFAEMSPERQGVLLELIVWMGPLGMDGVLFELEQLSLPLTDGSSVEPSPWFDRAGNVRARDRRLAGAGHCETTFESFGVIARLETDDPDLHDAAETVLPPGWRAVDGEPTVRFGVSTDGVITVADIPVDRCPNRETSLLKLASTVRYHVATEAPTHTFVHAGVVDVEGCAIVIPGRSYSGKSTLVAELVRLGAAYVSDEYAVVDLGGHVLPFAKPLSIRTGRHDPLGQLVPVPERQVAEHPVRVGLIVVTSYAPGATWRPSVRARAEGMLALLQNTVSARRRPSRALHVTSRLSAGAVVLAGQRGEASEAARALLETALLHAGRWNTVRL